MDGDGELTILVWHVPEDTVCGYSTDFSHDFT